MMSSEAFGGPGRTELGGERGGLEELIAWCLRREWRVEFNAGGAGGYHATLSRLRIASPSVAGPEAVIGAGREPGQALAEAIGLAAEMRWLNEEK